MTSDAQRLMLFRLFGRLAKARGWNTAQRDAQRRSITIAALMGIKSWTDLTNGDVDKLKMRLLFLLQPENLSAGCADAAEQQDEAGERKRLIYAIERDAKKGGLSDNYIVELLRMQHLPDVRAWRELPLDELTSLRNLVHNRGRAKVRGPKPRKRKKSGSGVPPLNPKNAKRRDAASTLPPLRVVLEHCFPRSRTPTNHFEFYD